MFNFIKEKLKNVYTSFTQTINSLFSRNTIDQKTLNELEKILITADTGVKTTQEILKNLQQHLKHGSLKNGSDLKKELSEQLHKLLISYQVPKSNKNVFLLVGINGSGKTTFVGKLAHSIQQENKRALLVAGDTFRAAATEQLKEWATRTNSDIVIGKQDQDPASVIFSGCQTFHNGDYDTLIIDTAGRLQTKTNLMRELEKIKKIINKKLPGHTVKTLLTIDAMLGQNSLAQARIFNESTHVDGIVLTKMDGTGKGGIAFSITQELNIPIAYLSFGEKITDIALFQPGDYINTILE